MRTLVAVALCAGLCSGTVAGQQAASSIPNGRVREGTLSFDGHASVGDFIGTTSTVSGEMTGGPDLGAVRGWVEAPVKTLKTGNGKRDKDLNKSMESDKYPVIRFDLMGVTPSGGAGAGASDRAASDHAAPDRAASGVQDSTTSAGTSGTPVTLRGAMTIHGVRREVNLPATVVLREAEARVRSDFPLNLKDYRIGGLSKAFGILRMDEHIEVHVDLTFQLQSPVSGAR